MTCYNYDRELVRTIESCFNNAEGDIIVGLEYCGTEEIKNELLSKFGNRSDFRFMYTPLEDNVGIAQGRINAASMYDGEDYFLQIDSHTKFERNWDTFLINKFKSAKMTINNNKIVLTGNLSPYYYTDYENDKYESDNELLYTRWVPNEFLLPDRTIPYWNPYEKDELPEEVLHNFEKTGFAPASKIVAMFMFSDHHLPDQLSIPNHIIFWEEEIIQSIELIYNGFTLVCPGFYIPISHFYGDRKGEQESITRTKSHLHVKAASRMMYNFQKYITDNSNSKKIKTFEAYNGISVLYGTKRNDCFPKSYINISNNDIIS